MCHNVSEATRLDQATGRQVDARNKWLAIYILGQIHHSLDQPEKAIKQYRQVEGRFDDARASIEEFQRKRIQLRELTSVPPGDRSGRPRGPVRFPPSGIRREH
jgi:alpha-2-macroglobulin